uniref:E2F/DP family winged-helix DNA-binding domain-containing protein n=1 Tax=Amphiprion ocellaris TaxID=80972 RepID=A0A3Q1BW86_AMPOC
VPFRVTIWLDGMLMAKKLRLKITPCSPLKHLVSSLKRFLGIFSAPAPSPVARKSLFERSRCDTSLGLLTQGFAELLHRSADGVLDLNVVTQKLNAPKRRVYDVTNVLEGVKLLKKNCLRTVTIRDILCF